MRYIVLKGEKPERLKVRISTEVIDYLGRVSVNWKSLEELYRRALKLNEYQFPRTTLKRLPANQQNGQDYGVLFSHNPKYRNTPTIDPVAIASRFAGYEATQLISRIIINYGMSRYHLDSTTIFNNRPDPDYIAEAEAASSEALRQFGPPVTFASFEQNGIVYLPDGRASPPPNS